MSTLEKVKSIIIELPDAERRRLYEWLDGLEEADWDRQIEDDSKSGKLDPLIRQADEDIGAGRYKDL